MPTFIIFFNVTCREYISLSFFVTRKSDTWTKPSVSDNTYVQMFSPVLDGSKFKFLHQGLNGIIFPLSHVCVVK